MAIPDNLVAEILSRFPPDTPEYLLRAGLVCKRWIRLITEPAFHRRLYELHGSPPILGFLHDDGEPNFFRAISSPFTLAGVPDRHSWRVVDYRHGRAAYISKNGKEILIWELLTGDKQRLQVPTACEFDFPGVAVVCAVPGCDHDGGCRGGHFQVALVFSDFSVFDSDEAPEEEQLITQGCVFSSATASWSDIISVNCLSGLFGDYPSILLKDSKIYFLTNGWNILEYNISTARLSVVEPPCLDASQDYRIMLMVTNDGELGVAEQREEHLVIWSRDLSGIGEMNWVESSSVQIGQYSLVGCTLASSASSVFFVGKLDGLYSIELHPSGLKQKKLCTEREFYPVVPICFFYTPKAPSFLLQWMEDEHPVLPSNASEHVGQEGEGGTELAQQLDIKSITMKRPIDVDLEEPYSKRVAFTLT